MKNKRLTFTFTLEHLAKLLKKAKKAGFMNEETTDREAIYLYLCQREGLEPVKQGGRREEAIAGTIAYHRKKAS